MPGLRAAIVAMPPLLAGIVRHALVAHPNIVSVTALPASSHMIWRLRTLNPDLVIIHDANGKGARDAQIIAKAVKHVRIVTLSRDAKFILAPGGKRELTAASLAALLG